MKCSPWKCLVSFAGALLPPMQQAKLQCSGQELTSILLICCLYQELAGWHGRKQKQQKETVYILNNLLLRNVASHFPAFLTAYCSCDCIEEKLVVLDLGWLSGVLVCLSGGIAAGLQGLLCFCSFRPDLCSNQQSLRVTGKKIPLGHELPLFLLAFSPSQADRLFFFPTLPSRPISPTKLSVPTPECLYSYLTSKYTLASFKTLVLGKHVVSYLEAK